MTPKYDASKLLYAKLENDRFLHKLNISEVDKLILLDARKKGRKVIRQAFHNAKHLLQEGFDDFYRKNPHKEFVIGNHREFVDVTPAFWPQGSFSYHTMNNPAYTPPQQFDLDDGVYLPMDMFEEMPIYSKDLFFEIVDKALYDLAKAEGWGFQTKDTCARIVINSKMHLDFPMYAMPRTRFEELKQKNQIALNRTTEAYEFNEAVYDSIELDPNDVYLAVRNEEHWIKSDPKQIEIWFKNEIELHGKRLRRVCRFLKAWRDNTWKKGGPSSIVLMVCAVNVFNDNPTFNRDCEALLKIAKKLPSLFSGEIFNPAVTQDEEEMFQCRHSDAEVRDIIEQSYLLEESLTKGLVTASSTQEVVNQFINSFGERIPNKCHWVSQLTTISPSGKAKKQAPPLVPSNVESGSNIETG